MDAADFHDSNLGCFQSCLRTLYDEVRSRIEISDANAKQDICVVQERGALSLGRGEFRIFPSQTYLSR